MLIVESSFRDENYFFAALLHSANVLCYFSQFLQKEVSKMMRQGMEEVIQYEKKTDEKKRVYTYEKAVERYNTGYWAFYRLSGFSVCALNCQTKPLISFRLLTANPTLSKQSVRILLERGLVQVEGG